MLPRSSGADNTGELEPEGWEVLVLGLLKKSNLYWVSKINCSIIQQYRILPDSVENSGERVFKGTGCVHESME